MNEERLTLQTRIALSQAAALVDRDRALSLLVEQIDATDTLSTNKRAGVIAGRLKWFQETAWPRIGNGYREPKNDFEEALAALCRAECPSSQRRLFDLLADLDL